MNKKRTAKQKASKLAASTAIASTTVVASQILASFGNTAMADCGGYGGNVCLTIVPQDFCVTDNTAVSVNIGNYSPHPFDASLADPGGENYYITTATVSDGANQVSPFDSFTTTPSSTNFNGYPVGPPTPVTAIEYDFSFTTPDVPANTGPISLGNGRREYVIDLYAEAREWNGSAYVIPDGLVTEPDEQITVTVDHTNTAPVISNPTQPQTITVPDESVLIDFDVSVDISDIESNVSDVTFELSDDAGFSNIIQTGSYPAQALTPTDQTFEHTWTDLPIEMYYWRAIATETDAVGTCTGFSNAQSGNNFTVEATSIEVVVTTADQPAPTPTPAVLPETGLFRDNLSILDFGFIFLVMGLGGLMYTIYQAAQNYEKLFNRVNSKKD